MVVCVTVFVVSFIAFASSPVSRRVPFFRAARAFAVEVTRWRHNKTRCGKTSSIKESTSTCPRGPSRYSHQGGIVPDRRLLDITGAAEYTSQSTAAIRALVRHGILRPVQVPSTRGTGACVACYSTSRIWIA